MGTDHGHGQGVLVLGGGSTGGVRGGDPVIGASGPDNETRGTAPTCVMCSSRASPGWACATRPRSSPTTDMTQPERSGSNLHAERGGIHVAGVPFRSAWFS